MRFGSATGNRLFDSLFKAAYGFHIATRANRRMDRYQLNSSTQATVSRSFRRRSALCHFFNSAALLTVQSSLLSPLYSLGRPGLRQTGSYAARLS